ncbi:FG-GAP repeat protein, partial [Candidatus Sumerlaeota bacterium]|nr:FG-GAP repeat protein [Candidatus Sumerlaeota bacterium]
MSEYNISQIESAVKRTEDSTAGYSASLFRKALFSAPNRAHNLRTYFTEEGPRVVRRTETEPSWEWGLELMNATVIESVATNGNRIEFHREDGLIEWYVNDSKGLEQGFTVPEFTIDSSTSEIRLEVKVHGSLRPGMAPDNKSIEFLSEGGVGIIRYGEMKAWDATGKELPGRMELCAAHTLQRQTPSIQSVSDLIHLCVDVTDAQFPVTIDPLATSAAWTAESNQEDAYFGSSVSTAGDVNGDGYSDVIVGAEHYDNGQADEGRVFVYHGSASGLSGSADWSAESDQANAYFGASVSTAGDVNGDGYSDVIIGAYGYDNGQADEGRVYVFQGSASGLLTTASWTAECDQTSASLGVSVSTAGDVNGDGYSDVIVGASNYDNGQTDEGSAFVYHGSASGLSASASWTAECDQTSASLGISVATAGDVNGDGYTDVIISASNYDNGQTDEGCAFVYHGSASGLFASAAWTAESDQNNAYFGCSVATAGDVNGDGYSDVIVGASCYNNGQTDEGSAFIYYGSSSGLAASASWTAESDQDNAYFGGFVSTAGDVNGDGYSDVVVGASRYDNGQSDEGEVFVYYGSASGVSVSAAWTAECDQTTASFGVSVSTAGDINGDGYSDVIVGAANYDNGQTDEGRAFVYHGAASGLSATANWSREGNQSSAFYGSAVSTAGDVNGDGYSDVIVGAPNFDSGQTNEGRAYVYHGSASGLSTSVAWYAESNQESAFFGTFASTAGDVNGDGYSDIIVSATRYDNGQTDEGRAYVYHGSASGLSASAAWTAESNQANAWYGHGVTTAGDVNGDGYSDVIVGAPFYDHGQSNEGRAFVYYGSASGLSASASWTAESNRSNAAFGVSVSTAGDVNGDGFSDVIIGAYGYANGQTEEGRIYVYHGSASGLSSTANWTAESDQTSAYLGYWVSTAGDVNGDGYSDVIAGAAWGDGDLEDEGLAFVYHGSALGLSGTPAWAAEGDMASARFGCSVSTAGDINGDGYSDVIVGAFRYNNGQYSEGAAFMYRGSVTGLSSTADWVVEGNQTYASLGICVSAAGDVNGDGYGDVIVGASQYSNGQSYEGRAYVYYGNGETGRGMTLRPRVRTNDNSAPVPTLGKCFYGFRLAALGRIPFGRGKTKLECEIKPFGTPFDGSGTFMSEDWSDTGVAGYIFNELMDVSGGRKHWRMRLHYHPATTPFMPASRWFTIPINGWEEADFLLLTEQNLIYSAAEHGSISGEALQTVFYGEDGTGVEAIPDTGYHFVQWSDGFTTNPRVDTNVTTDISVTASFAINQYSLIYSAGPNGSIDGITTQTVNHGGDGTSVETVPDVDYHFVQWSDGSTANSRIDTNVTTDISVTASFAYNENYTLTYFAGAHGSISGVSPQIVSYGNDGTEVEAVGDTGYHFVQWNDSILTATRTDTFVTTDISVTASFAINQYTVTFETDGTSGATLDGATSQTVEHGDDCTSVTAVAPEGWHFSKWTESGADYSTSIPLTVTYVVDDMVLIAVFEINQYTLNYAADTNGLIDGATSQTVNYDSSGTTVTALGNTGYHFVQWSDGALTAARRETNVTTDIAVTASFEINQYTVTFETDGTSGTTLDGASSQTVTHGADCTAVTANAPEGWHFLKWTEGGADYSTSNPLTIIGVTKDMALTAVFEINQYTLNYAAGANGSIDGATSQTVNYDSSGTTVTAIGDTGYHFIQWNDGALTAARRETNVTTDIAVTASFEINQYTVTFETDGTSGTMLDGASSQTVVHGDDCTSVTANAPEGWHFSKWTEGGADYSTSNPLVVNSVADDMALIAIFEIDQYTLTYTAGLGGAIDGMTSQMVDHGDSGTTVTAIGDTGYHFIQWNDGALTAARRETNV